MILLEIAAQAVRGMSPAVRVQLKGGYQVLRSPGESCTPVAGLFSALCYPDGRGGDGAFLAPGQKTGKAGFGLQGKDKSWRVVRDLGGSGALHQFNVLAGKFEVLTQDATEIAQMLRSAAGLPPRTTFEQLFSFRAEQLPSRRPKGESGDKKKKADKPGAASGPIDVAAERERLTALAQELALSQEIAEVQFKLDGMASELFALEAKTKVVEDARARVARSQQDLATSPTLESLGLISDDHALVKRYPAEVQKYQDAKAKLEAERGEQVSEVVAAGPVAPLQSDQRFLAAMVLGLAAVIGAMFLKPSARAVALLGIPAFSFAALLALRWVEDLQGSKRSTGKVDRFAAREKKLDQDHDALVAKVKAVLARARVESAEELQAALDRREVAQEQLNQASLTLEQLEQDPETAGAVQRAQALKADQDALNQQLVARAGGYVRSPGEVERDIAQTNERIAEAQKPVPEEPEFEAVDTDGAERFDDPMPALMVLATDLLHADVPTLWAGLKDRCAQYVGALTDKRYHGLEVDKDGRAKALAPGRSVPLAELPGKDLDLVYLGARLCVLEKALATEKVPVFFEDACAAGWPEPRRQLLLKMLRHLGTTTQVLHVTPAGHAAGPNDVVHAL